MKTTFDIPDAIFRQSEAAQQGIPLRQFVSDAVTENGKSPAEKGRG